MGDINSGRGFANVGIGVYRNILPSAQFCYELKTALKKVKSILKGACNKLLANMGVGGKGTNKTGNSA